ncbi:MAG: amidohydrolase [Candidatus Eremiobacterota bacterium]
MLYVHGRIGPADSLRCDGERIVEVGRELQPRPGEPVHDMAGGVILPGLWDAHLHFLLWSLKLRQVDLSGCPDPHDFLARLGRAQDGDWLQGQGWTEAYPTLEELDRATGDRPALLWRADLHSALANSAALRRAGVESGTPDPAGGRIERDHRGRPTGMLRELAIGLVSRCIPDPSQAEVDQALRAACARLHALGVTAISDQRLKDHDDGVASRAAYRRLKLPLRIHCNVAAHELDALPDETPEARRGHVKFFSDGTLGSRTAAMLEPYEGETSGRGIWLTPVEGLREGFARSRRMGLPISVHAIGDAAVRTCLDLLEELGPAPGVPDRIEHVQFLSDRDLGRLAALGVTASMQPVHMLDDMDLSDRLVGPRSRTYYRLASLRRWGTRLAFGSDAPVADPNPWLGMHAAVQRRRPDRPEAWVPEERLDLPSALAAYTAGAAEAAGRKDLGVLSPGALADFAVIDREPEPDNLLEIRVLSTVVGGVQRYPADQGPS